MSPIPKAPVLIVDDESGVRRVLRTALEAAAYVVLEASNGKDALGTLTAEGGPEPCLIVLDLNMPVMTGWEFLAIMKSYHRLAKIPVIVISGGDLHLDALAHGAVAECLMKPFTAEAFLARVAAALRA